jgi:hypothetical protein
MIRKNKKSEGEHKKSEKDDKKMKTLAIVGYRS